MITMQRRITIEYDDISDCAYVYFTPKEVGTVCGRNTVQVDLSAGEDIYAKLVLDRDELNRILGIEVLGAMGLLRPEFLLDDDDTLDWTSPPASIMRRVRSMSEKAAIKTFVERVHTIATETRRDVATVFEEESRLL